MTTINSNPLIYVLNLFLNPYGRIGRASYALGMAVLLIAHLLCNHININVYSLIFMAPVVILSIKRLHDQGFSGFVSLLLFVPIINIGILMMCVFCEGFIDTNQYGKSDNLGSKIKKSMLENS